MSLTVFQDGTVYAKSKLDMVNRCLLAIGEVPLPAGTLLPSLELGTDANVAIRVVEETMIEVQSIGWYFNLDYDFKLYKDVDDFISVPPNALRMDILGNPTYIIKGGKVYDINKQTYKIEPTYIEVDMVWLTDYTDIPPEAYEYIAARSARKFQAYVISAPELTQLTSQAEADAYVRLQRRQLQTRTYNIQNDRVSNRVSNGALRRGLYIAKYRR